MSTLEEAKELAELIEKDPLFIIKNIIGAKCWPKQEEIIRAVFENQRVSVASCNASGKSWTAANLALDYLYTFPDSIVITTAPTWRQVANVIWRELRGAHANSKYPLGGKLLQTSLEISPNWYAMGLASDEPDNMRGIHSQSGRVLLLVDEAGGMDADILDALEGNLASAFVSLLYIGNPTSGVGRFYDSHKSQLFKKITISAFDTPNFTANGIKTVEDLKKFQTLEDMRDLKITHPFLVTPQWAWGRLMEWGEDSSIFQSLVMGQFPEEGDDTLIPLKYVLACKELEVTKEMQEKNFVRYTIGIDVARFGSDTTVFTVFDGTSVLKIEWHAGKDLMDSTGKAVALFNEFKFAKKRDYFIVDDTGLGGGLTDRLVEQGYNVLRVNFGESSQDDRFVRIKDEMFWHLREKIIAKGIKLIDKGKLLSQLPTLQFTYLSNGCLEILSKTQMKKKGLESPDFADSLALAVWGSHSVDAYVHHGRAEQKRFDYVPTLGGNMLQRDF